MTSPSLAVIGSTLLTCMFFTILAAINKVTERDNTLDIDMDPSGKFEPYIKSYRIYDPL